MFFTIKKIFGFYILTLIYEFIHTNKQLGNDKLPKTENNKTWNNNIILT